MKYVLKHKGYYGKIYYSKEDEAYVGKVLGFRGMIAVHEDTVSETIKELVEAIDEYLLDCAEEGWAPNTTDPAVVREMEAYFEYNSQGDSHVIPVHKDLAFAY